MFFLAFFLGFSISYLGTVTPSMLNITATKISIEKDKKTGINFSIGVSFIVLFQAFFALLFLKVIYSNPIILETIQSVSIIIFAVLSIFFFRTAIQEQKEIVTKKSKKNGFLTGIGLSLINMFSIPFYCGVGAALNMYGWLELDLISVSFFVLGSALGTYFILYHYILLAEKIKPKIAKFSKYFNFFLGAITGIVALGSLIKLL
jgi:threonine/homoserine/homoserine lactone efflux protein